MGFVSNPAIRRSWVEQIMGMPISLLARGDAAPTARVADMTRRLFDELVEVDAVFSPYRTDSDISRLARGEVTLADCQDVVREVADRCEQARIATSGLFDAQRADGVWDPSGLVKGWAVERASRHLQSDAEVDWCVNAGGDVLVFSASGSPFTVGIQDPRQASQVAATLQCASGAVATSGTAARGEHLYDPRTGGPAAPDWLSITVTGPSLETADVLATAAFVAGAGWVDVVATVPGYGALGISPHGVLRRTVGWPSIPPGKREP